MKKILKFVMLCVSAIFLSSTFAVDSDTCYVKGRGTYSFISNSQPTFIYFSKELENCKDIEVDWKIQVDNKAATYEALIAPKSPLAGAIMSNAQFGKYQAEGLLLPLTKIIEKNRHKYPQLTDDMLIKIDDEIYSIAFVTNLQHFVYRKDLFAKYNIEQPKTYSELLKILRIIKEKGEVDYPFGAAYKSGWNLATEFTNLYLSTGKDFFKAGTSLPKLNNSATRKVLRMMKKLYSYSSPNSLSLASGDVISLFQNGSIGAMQMWASRAQSAQDPKLSKVVGKVEMSSALKLSKKSPYPASSMFWDGFAIPKTTQNDSQKTFELFMELLDKETVEATNEKAVWMSKYATPSRFAKGIVETRKNNVRIFPTTPQFSLLHVVIGKNIGDYLSGLKSAKNVIRKIEREYKKAAKDKGLL